ncbi:MAG: PAS domain S-box protein [Planctomycetota bacterium]|nr:PAS domain S-box protein [Planctomycetota bacterium]
MHGQNEKHAGMQPRDDLESEDFAAVQRGGLEALQRRVADLEEQLAVARATPDGRKWIHDALWRSEAQHKALFASLLDATVVIDDHGRIHAASDSVKRIFGFEPQELVGRNIKMLMAEPHQSQHDQYLENYRRTGFTHILGRTREFEVLRKDGTQITCELSVARADFPGGWLFTGAFRDVTEKKAAEAALRESERRFHALFDSTFQFIGLLRPDGILVEANQTACDSAGVTREEVLGRPFWDTSWWSHSIEMQTRIREGVARAALGEFVRFEIAQRTRSGATLDIDFSLTPIKDEAGRVVMLIPEGRNVTELKTAQRAETSMLRALAQIGESAAVLAHEIKNPITAVNLALRAVADKLGADEHAILADLVARMQRLEHMMRGTLSFAKPLRLKPIDLDARTLYEDTVAHLRSQLQHAGAEVRIHVPNAAVRFHGDGQLFEEVLSNLIMNAVEAKGTGAHIDLFAGYHGRHGVLLAIEDDGPGIPEEQRASVFKPFVTTKACGTGLGLPICRKIVEEHGGKIEITSGASGGARFEIRLENPV